MSKIKLMAHQQDVYRQTERFNKVAYYLDMGLGKTFIGSEKAMYYDNRVLVVCQKSKVSDWVEHFKTFYPDDTIEDLTKKKPTYTGDVMIINYDIVYKRDELKKLHDFTLMLDESSLIKNSKAKRTKAVQKLNYTNLILLSGTPVGGKYEELLSQVNMLGWKITKKRYWDQYVKWFDIEVGGFPIPKVTGYKNIPLLKSNLKDHGCIFMKSDEVLTLPQQVETIVNVPSTPQYKKMYEDRVVTIEGEELVGELAVTQLLYLRWLSGYYNKNKLDKFKELVESTEDRLIVFYWYTQELQRMSETVKKIKRPISIVNGDVKDIESYKAHSNSVTFVQYQAGAMGLNLQLSNKMIFFSLPQSCELYEQSLKRIHRIGQDRTCFYWYLMTEDSVEYDIYETLKKRKDYNFKLFEKENRKDG